MRWLNQNKTSDKTYFSHDPIYADKYLAKRTVSGKVLKYRAYEIAFNTSSDGYHRILASTL